MKRYTLEMIYENGKHGMSSQNDGFNGLELIGFLEWKKQDLLAQMNGIIEPETISRKLVVDEVENEKLL